MSLKSFLLNPNNVTRNGFVWNTMSSGLFALQSLVMLIVVEDLIGQVDAGMLVIAQAIAFLLGCVGTFGVARFQASDVKQRFSFANYAAVRLVTILVMWAAGAVVLVLRADSYGSAKITIVVLMILLKTIDVIDDVIFGYFQQHGRIDIGARETTIRYLTSIIVFTVVVVATRQLITSLIITTAASAAVLALLASITLRAFMTAPDRRFERRDLIHLLVACAPLFVAWFLAAYVTNAPKYSIDAASNELTQAVYGFLVTPAFVVSLIAQFLFNPLIYHYSLDWTNGRVAALRRRVMGMLGVILGLGAAVCGIGYLIGLPVLGWVYKMDLKPYLAEFMVLMVASATTAISAFLYTVLTIMRQQTALAISYVVVSLGALFGGAPLVRQYGLMGASLLYVGLTLTLSVCFLAITLVRMAIDARTTTSPAPLPA